MPLTILNVFLLVAYALFMAFGQIAFRLVSRSLPDAKSLIQVASSMPMNGWFWVTAIIYGTSMIYWVWLLGRVPLAVAYPFASLALLFLPLLLCFIYGEHLTINYFVGAIFVILGLTIIVR